MILALISFFTSLQSIASFQDSLQVFQIKGFAQGTSYNITYYANKQLIDKSEVDALLYQIDSSLSLYKSYSRINQFNLHKRGVQMDQHLYSVVKKAIEISYSTNKAFDITCKPFIQLWNAQASSNSPPNNLQIKNIQQFVGSQHLKLIKDSLVKDAQSVQIDCDGIAQGYSVDQIAQLIKQKNIKDFIVELGGEVYANGHPPRKPAWHVAIQSFADESFENDSTTILLTDYAITTSGSMSKFKKLGNKYYSHIFDPNTGRPIQTKIISVTVLAKDAMTADALDNAFMVMGIDRSINWLLNHPEVGVLIQYLDENGTIRKKSNDFFKRYLSN